MAERSPRADGFSRGRLVVGLLLVSLLGAGVAFGLSRLRSAPDPGRIYYADPHGVYEHDLETGTDRRVAELPDASVASISPDGRWVAYLSEGRLLLTGLDGDTDTEIVVADRLTVPLGWTPDNRLVAGELLSDGDVVAVDPEGGRDLLFSGVARGATPVFLDDERFAISRTAEEFVIVEDREPVASTEGVPLVASADGAELLLQRDGEVAVAKIEGGSVADPRTVFEGRARRAATSREGFVAITGEDDDGRKGVWVLEGGTDTRRVLDQRVDWLGWSAESSHLLYARKGAIHALPIAEGESKPVSRTNVEVFGVLSFAVVP